MTYRRVASVAAFSRLARASVLVAGLSLAALVAGCAGGQQQRQGIGGQPIPAADMDLLSKQQFVNADGDAARSEALYQSLLRKLPNDADTWFRLGNLYAQNNRPDPAIAAYGRALVADNAHVRAWHNLAVVQLRQAYASLMQAQVSVDANDEVMARRIDNLLDELSRISALADERRPQPRTAPAADAKPAAGGLMPAPAPEPAAPAAPTAEEKKP